MTIDSQRVKEIFLEAAELPDEAARTAYLDQACGADAAVRERVEALLRSHDPDGSFLGTPAAVLPDPDLGVTFGFAPNHTAQTREDEANASEEALSFLAPPTRPDSLGRLGHYEVLQILGKGGFGIVFRAFDEMLQRVVALKVMAPQLAATSPARKRFLREARSSAQVRHENVVQVYEVAEQPLPYLAMEFIPGETLQQKLDRVGPFDVPEVLRIGRQIAEGLAAAHATDLIHRDIKPGNVLLEGGSHKAKITDFGLARAADDASISQSGIIAGTPMYMAPEQAQGQPIDQRADLFSLGSVLYQMVAGRPPFRANTTVAVLKRVAEDQPRAIRETIPEAPQWLCDIIAKLHAKDPDDRYQSAREVADVLADCEAQLKSHSRLKDYSRIPRSNPQPSGPRPRLHSRRWAAAAAVLLLFLGGLGFTEATGVTNLHGTVIRLFSPEGTLVVEVDDPGVSIKIDESDIVISGAGVKEIRLKPGSYTVEARKDGNVLMRELVTVTRDGRQVVRISQEPVIVAKAAPAKNIATNEPLVPVAAPEPLPRTFTNSIGMEFVIVPKGKFLMGGSGGNPGTKEVITPHDFYLGRYEVTQWEWMLVMENNPSRYQTSPPPKPLSKEERGKLTLDEVRKLKEKEERDKENYPKSYPVENVSRQDCQEFIQRLNEKEKPVGWVYCLPNEAEWEYACRGGGDRPVQEYGFDYYFEQPTNLLLPEMANFGDSGKNRTCKVGSYKPNRLGLYDMHGNVWEWCRDEVPGDPKDPKAASLRVYRGGCWRHDSGNCRAANRSVNPPSHRHDHLGLRLARVPSGDASPEAKTPTAIAPFTDADVQRIAALPAAEQVEEVRKELKRRNPGFDGKMDAKIEDGVVTELRIVNDKVTDIAPIRVFNALRVLDCGGTWTSYKPSTDLTALKGMNLADLTYLKLRAAKVGDAGMVCFKDCKNLTYLDLFHTQVSDAGLGNFKDCKALTYLSLDGTKVSDAGLGNFKECKDLTHLGLGGTKVSDAGLGNFKDCKNLTELLLLQTEIGDAGLADFKGMPLRVLWINDTGIIDLTPLQGLPLEDIRLTPKKITKGLEILRDMMSLKTIGVDWDKAWPAAEFWERYDKGEFGRAFTDADVKRIAALPAADQVEVVRKELMRRNPGFDGKMETKIEGGVVTEFKIVADQVTDIAPIRVWNELRVLGCGGTYNGKSKGLLADLAPLEGMNLRGLRSLDLQNTRVTDTGLSCFQDGNALWVLVLTGTKVSDVGLVHFKNCKNLIHLDLGHTEVDDAGLAHFKECKNLTSLQLGVTRVSAAGLTNLQGMPLRKLWIYNTPITDLTPLQGLPLEEIRLTPKDITRGLDVLRDMQSLKSIGINSRQAWPAAEFWERYDKGEFKE